MDSEHAEDWIKPLEVPQMPPDSALRALLGYLELDNNEKVTKHLNLSGKSVDALCYSSHIRYMRKAAVHGRNKETDDTSLFLNKEAEEQSVKQRERNAWFAYRRKLYAKKNTLTVEDHIARTFAAYGEIQPGSDATSPDIITCVGVVRMCRDTGILDNKMGYLEIDDIYEKRQQEALSKFATSSSTEKPPSEHGLDLQSFTKVLQSIAAVKFPEKRKEELMQAFVDAHIGPLGKNKGEPFEYEELLTRGNLQLWRTHEAMLRKIFAHYATLDYISANLVSWKGVKENNSTLNIDEFLMFMINFQVNPILLSRRQLIETLRFVDNHNDADETVDALLFPALFECLARIAVSIVDNIPAKLADSRTTVTDLMAIRRFMSFLPQFQRTRFEAILERRGYNTRTTRRDVKKPEQYQAVATEILQKNTQKVQQWEQQYKAYQLYLRHEAQMRTISRHNHHHALAKESGALAKFGRRGPGSGPLPGASNNTEDPDSLNVTVGSLKDYIENRLPPLRTFSREQRRAKKEFQDDVSLFEDNLKHVSWLRPYDEMRNWKSASS